MSNIGTGAKLALVEWIYDYELLDWCEQIFLIYILVEFSFSCTDHFISVFF